MNEFKLKESELNTYPMQSLRCLEARHRDALRAAEQELLVLKYNLELIHKTMEEKGK